MDIQIVLAEECVQHIRHKKPKPVRNKQLKINPLKTDISQSNIYKTRISQSPFAQLPILQPKPVDFAFDNKNKARLRKEYSPDRIKKMNLSELLFNYFNVPS